MRTVLQYVLCILPVLLFCFFRPMIAEKEGVNCTRTLRALPNGNYEVEVLIYKPGIIGFAKFQDLMPTGCTAKGLKLAGSAFSVADGKAKFVWVSLPTTDRLLISYQLTTGSAEPPKLSGEFSYLEDNLTKKFNLSGDNFTMASAKRSGTVKSEPVAAKTAPVKVAEKPVHGTPVSITASTSTNKAVFNKMPGVHYSVQLGAFKSQQSVEAFSKKYQIQEPILAEASADGYVRFLLGNFSSQQEALKKRDEMMRKGIQDCYVVMYNQGKRSPLKNAQGKTKP